MTTTINTIRRTIFFIATIIIAAWGGWALAWNPETVRMVTERPGEAIGGAIALVGAILIIIYNATHPSRWGIPVGMILGIIGYALIWPLLAVGGATMSAFVIGLAVVIGLWAGTIVIQFKKLRLPRWRPEPTTVKVTAPEVDS